LLTGERGHYELAAGRAAKPFLQAMERFASTTGLLPEQAWDAPDQPQTHMFCGRPTGSAMPLMWAHAEYIKLLRSVRDGKVYDRIAEVAKRYLGKRAAGKKFEVWKFTRQVRSVKPKSVLRIQVPAAFRLHWSADEWRTVKDTVSSATALGVEFVDIPISAAQRAPVRFTFFWTAADRWEGRDYMVAIA
jgi:glucoamylase